MSAETNQSSNSDLHAYRSGSQTLFKHIKREQWGLAIVDEKSDETATLIFEDGRKHRFHRDFYHLIQAVDRPYDVAKRIYDGIAAMSSTKKRASRSTEKPVSVEEQVTFFKGVFDDGFGEEYGKEHRGDGRARALKRHRDGLVDAATEHLDEGEIRAALLDGEFSDVVKRATAVLNATDMVAAKERKAFSTVAEEHHEELANAIVGLLYDKGDLQPRFEAWTQALSIAVGAPSWALVTGLLGARYPQEHLIIDVKTARLQAEWMAAGMTIAIRPSYVQYQRILEMFTNLKGQLGEADLEPKDMLDVVTFAQITLKASARNEILASRKPVL